MFQLPADVPVYLHRAPVDFRLGMNGLAATVEHAMQRDPLARAVYAFCNRRCNRIKLLLYDRTGFWLLTKRLEADRFVWPKQESTASTSKRSAAIRHGTTGTLAEVWPRVRMRRGRLVTILRKPIDLTHRLSCAA